MSSQRHTIRKLDYSESTDFDEQLWPVNLALVLLCGCVAGVIWARSDFQTPDLLENGYARLVTLVGSVFVLGLLARNLGGRQARRLQLAAFLSLALHFAAAIGAIVWHPRQSEWADGPKREAGKRELREIDILPDYRLTSVLPNRVQEDHEKPVETKIPESLVIEANKPQPREQAADLGALRPRDAVAIADPTPNLIAPPLERKPIEPAAPRRGDLDARLAKQQTPTVTTPAAGPVPSIDLSVPTSKAGPLEARSMPLGHQTTDPLVPRRPDDAALAMVSGLMQPGGPRSAPAPRANDQPSPLVAAGPTLVKTITQPGPAPRGDAPTPATSAKAAIPDLGQLQPATGAGRQRPAGAVVGRAGMEIASAAPIADPTLSKPTRQAGPKSGTEPSAASAAMAPRIAPRTASFAAGAIADLNVPVGQTSLPSADGGPGPGPLSPARTQIARGTPVAGAPARPAAPALSGSEGAGGFGVTVALAGPQPGRSKLAAGPNPDASLPLGGPVGIGKQGFSGIGTAASAAPVARGDLALAVTLPGASGPSGPGGPVANNRATGAVRSAPGSGVPGGALFAGGNNPGDGPGGNGGAGGNGQIGAAQIGRPGTGSEDLPGGIVGGTPGGLGAGIGRAGQPTQGSLVGDVKADLPQLAAGSPTGNGNQGSGAGGYGPGGDGSGPNGPGGSGIDGAVAGVGRQSTGGLPRGGEAGAGAENGPPGTGLDGVLGAVQVSAVGPAAGAPGLSGNGDGGPSAVGAGLGGFLPKSNSVGVPGSIDAPGAAPQFAGSPATSGPGNNASGAAGGPGGDGPGGPGEIGPGGDGSGKRYGNVGLPVPSSLVGNPDGTAASGVPQFGLPDRRALPDSDQLAISSGRFLQRQPGGGGPEIAADAPVRAPTPSFSGRGREGHVGKGNGEHGDSDGRTEQTIELGLAYLAQMQAADGSWSLHRFPGAVETDVGLYRSDTAATGLALLAFLGAGYDHFDDKYHNTVRRGLEYLLRHQKADGDLFLPMDQEQDKNRYARFYSHAIATIAVCEALGMTGDKRLREPAQKAINFIVGTQDKSYGGWRYDSGRDADTSVTGWETTALKSGELAGLNVPQQAFQRVAAWLDTAQVAPNDASRYIYRPQDPQSQDPRDSRRPTMTAVALLTRIYLGWRRDNPDLLRGAEFIKANLPRAADIYSRDTYYWYYATQVMFQLKGEYWRTWSERLHPLLINSQILSGPLAGSWDPQGRIPDRWGYVGGRIYVTTMNLLSLEVYYRHLPIYEVPPPK